MNHYDLLDAIGGVDEKMIAAAKNTAGKSARAARTTKSERNATPEITALSGRAEQTAPRRNTVRRWAIAAAVVLAILVAGAFVITPQALAEFIYNRENVTRIGEEKLNSVSEGHPERIAKSYAYFSEPGTAGVDYAFKQILSVAYGAEGETIRGKDISVALGDGLHGMQSSFVRDLTREIYVTVLEMDDGVGTPLYLYKASFIVEEDDSKGGDYYHPGTFELVESYAADDVIEDDGAVELALSVRVTRIGGGANIVYEGQWSDTTTAVPGFLFSYWLGVEKQP